MKRHWVYAVAVVLAIPGLAQAQADPGYGPKWRVTPWIGISPSIKQTGTVAIGTNNSTGFNEYEVEYSSSIPIGLNVEYLTWRQFAVVAGGAWSARQRGTFTNFDESTEFGIDGTNFWMAKLGVAMRLRESRPDMQLKRLNATIFAAPAIVHDHTKFGPNTPLLSRGDVNHFALNLGAEGEKPIGDGHWAFQLAMEDWMIFWDDSKFATRLQGHLENDPSVIAVATESDKTHLWIVRVGLTYRF